MTRKLNDCDALLIVHVQNDFCPGGALPVDGGDEVVPVLNRWIEAAQQGGAIIVASRDWHPSHHVSFKEQGGPWPFHCIQNTSGAAFHPELLLPEDAWIASTAREPDNDSFTAFDDPGLADRLKAEGVVRVWVGGLALDVCVKASALDALQAGFEVHLLLDACRAIDVSAGDARRAVEAMRHAGAIVEEGGRP